MVNDGTGSRVRVVSNGIAFGAGGGNNVGNNVSGNTPVVFEYTIGPAPAVSRPRGAISFDGVRGTIVRTQNERSPYVMRETEIIISDIATVALYSTLATGFKAS